MVTFGIGLNVDAFMCKRILVLVELN